LIFPLNTAVNVCGPAAIPLVVIDAVPFAPGAAVPIKVLPL
jgi:hypothetical protein